MAILLAVFLKNVVKNTKKENGAESVQIDSFHLVTAQYNPNLYQSSL